MAFGGFSNKQGQQPLAEINMVPMIDVMLVLLVIFIIAAPLITHAVKVDLPHAVSAADTSPSEKIEISIDREGHVFWNGSELNANDWRKQMQQAATRPSQPEVILHADGAVAYSTVAYILSDAAQAGLSKIGFATTPTTPH